MDGRDISTHVFPNAECKVFLTAALEERVKRCFLELPLKDDINEVALVELKKETNRTQRENLHH